MGLDGRIRHGTDSATLGDVLERILDKGVVIAGDIKVKLLDIELLTIQLKLVVCSVDKAREIGLDWWERDASWRRDGERVAAFEERLSSLEERLATGPRVAAAPPA